MTEPWGVYVLPIDGDPEFMEVPPDEWNDRFWKSGSCRRVIETPYVTEDREIHLLTFLRAENLEGTRHLEEPWTNPWVYGFPPAVPFLRGTVVLTSCLQGNGKELPLNVATLYGKRGISAILQKPWQRLHPERIPCDMDYIRRKVAELQNMPKEE